MAIKPGQDPNKPAVYAAEHNWQRGASNTGREITSRQARKLSRQIIKHPSLNDVPGIDKARKNLLNRVSVRSGLIEKVAPGTVAATNGLGITLFNKSKPITVGTVTHEVAHKILANSPVEGHGEEFTQLHRKIVQNTVGRVAEMNLGAAYARHGAR